MSRENEDQEPVSLTDAQQLADFICNQRAKMKGGHPISDTRPIENRKEIKSIGDNLCKLALDVVKLNERVRKLEERSG